MGYIKIDRKIFNNLLWNEKRPRTKFEAWIDLIQLVSYKNNNKQLINNSLVKWGRGQFPISRSFLAERWGWSDNQIRCFISLLKTTNQITTQTTSKITILTICKYEEYQDVPTSKPPAEPPATQPANHQQLTSRPPELNKSIITENRSKVKEEEHAVPKPSVPVLKKQYDFIDQVVKQFAVAYEENCRLPYVIMNAGKERAAAGKLLNEYKNKNPGANSEETLAGLKTYFDSAVKVNEAWFRDNMSLTLLMSKFNEINKIIINGKSSKSNNKGGASDEELASFYANKYASDKVVSN